MNILSVIIIIACIALIVTGVVIFINLIISSFKGDPCKSCPYKNTCSKNKTECSEIKKTKS
jgi:hypothetical protein